MTPRPPLDEVLALFQATVAAEGTTTGPGAAAGNSIVDAGLAGVGTNSFLSMLAVVYPGQPRLVDSMDITGFNNVTGEVTLSTAYKGVAAAIPAGVPYKIVTFRFVPAEVAAIKAVVDAILIDTGTTLEAKLDALALICTTARGLLIDRLSLMAAGGAGELTAARAALLSNLDAAISSRAPSATALSTADWPAALATALSAYTAAKAAFLDIAISSRSASGEALAALLTDALDHLMSLADGASVFPASAVNNSVISKILAKGSPATTNTYDNTTDSLEALSDKVALEATLTAIKGAGWTIETLHAMYDLIVAIPTTAMRGTDNAALAATALSTAQWTNALATALGSYTAALATALGNYTAARAGYLDNINQAGLLQVTAARAALLDQITAARLAELDAANIPADIDGLKTSRSRQLFSMDFWSEPQEEVIVPAAAGTLTLPSVIVADLPDGATIVRALAILKARMMENTNAAANNLDGATVAATSQVIQVQDSAAGGWVDAIKFVDNQFTIAALTREGGDVLLGSIDIANRVDANDTYSVRWLLAKADLASINLNDTQTGIRIFFSV